MLVMSGPFICFNGYREERKRGERELIRTFGSISFFPYKNLIFLCDSPGGANGDDKFVLSIHVEGRWFNIFDISGVLFFPFQRQDCI
jgi:hypothetical protein